MAQKCNDDYEVVVIIGGNILREVDYGFENAVVVYISPNLETHDFVSGAKLEAILAEKGDRIGAIYEVFENLTRDNIMDKAR